MLYHDFFLYCTGCRLLSTNVIVAHFSVANSLVMLSTGIPGTMAVLGWKHFLNDIECKLMDCAHRLGKGCVNGHLLPLEFLSSHHYQAYDLQVAEPKVRAPKYIGFSIFLGWILCMLINIIFTVYVSANWNNKYITKKKIWDYVIL